jgi:hypothetical protein
MKECLIQGRAFHKDFGVIATMVSSVSGINTFDIYSLSGSIHYVTMQIDTNNHNAINNWVISADIPFELLSSDPTQRPVETFRQCMQRNYTNCMNSWACGLACGLSLPECALGMTIACSGNALHGRI